MTRRGPVDVWCCALAIVLAGAGVNPHENPTNPDDSRAVVDDRAGEAAVEWRGHWIGVESPAEGEPEGPGEATSPRTTGEDPDESGAPGAVASGPGSGSRNLWICYRKTVDLPREPKSAIARIAVDSKYWLWINGRMVVFEGQLKRGPTPEDTYFDVVDLAGHLRRGRNSIAVLQWFFGKDGYSHRSSGKPAFIFEAAIDGSTVISDQTWKACVHPAYGDTGGPHPNFRLPESNIRFDARNDLVGWNQAGYDDSRWPAALVFGKPPMAPWNRLVNRPTPMWKDSGLKDYVNAPELPRVSDGRTVRARLPHNAQVTPYLRIESPAGLTVDLRTDNYRGGGPPNVRAEYVTRAGVQDYESLGWMNGHEVHYTIPSGVRILALKYRETGYDTEFTGTFECDDRFLNRLRDKSLRTLYITMRDTYLDCPDRERAQWWGDAVNELGEAFYAMDPRSGLLARKGILELMMWQRPDGSIVSPVPGNFDRELPMQMLNSVGFYGFWTYCKHSGDVATIRTVYPRVKRYLGLWTLGEDGLVAHRAGGWTWGDWGENKDMAVLFNGWYYLALKGQLEMATVVGHSDDLVEIRRKMASIEQNFDAAFWTGEAYRSAEHRGRTDDRANALAVLAGLAGPDTFDAIRRVLRTQHHASPYMEKYVIEALYVMRFAADGLERMHERYAGMVEHDDSTLWEHWQRSSGTVNHAWSGGPLTIMSQYIAGIAPTELGYRRYHVLPQLGPLERVDAVVDSVRGSIRVSIRRSDTRFTLDLQSPGGTTAIVGIPRVGEGVHVTVNGTSATVAREGLEPMAGDANYLMFEAAPGAWSFVAEYRHGR